jgi:hypothetical protein
MGGHEDHDGERTILKAIFSPAAISSESLLSWGDTPIYSRIHEIYQSGGVIAGASAGALPSSARPCWCKVRATIHSRSAS